MKAFCFALTILCAAQSVLAIPRPEFGISGTISGGSKISAGGTEFNSELVSVGASTVTINSGYGLLTTLKNALEGIGDAIVSTGNELGSQIAALVADTTGPVDTAFASVVTKIENLKTLLASDFGGKVTTITTNAGNYIERQLKDAFATITTTLNSLKTALNALKLEINKAKSAPGGATAANIKKFVQPKTVSDVLAQVRTLRANVPLIAMVIKSSLENLGLADEFVTALKAEIVRGNTEYTSSVQGFQTIVSGVGTSAGSSLTSSIGAAPSAILTPIANDLSPLTGYTTALSATLGQLGLATEITASTTAFTTSFSAYATNVPSLLPMLLTKFGNVLCLPLKEVTYVQITNAGFADFCFSKFSQKVFTQVSLALDAFDACFDKETVRLDTILALIVRVAKQISFNTEDLLGNMNLCLSLPTTTDKNSCFAGLDTYYQALVTKSKAHLTALATLVNQEYLASYNRAGSCLSTALTVTNVNALEVSTQAKSCLTSGPSPT